MTSSASSSCRSFESGEIAKRGDARDAVPGGATTRKACFTWCRLSSGQPANPLYPGWGGAGRSPEAVSGRKFGDLPAHSLYPGWDGVWQPPRTVSRSGNRGPAPEFSLSGAGWRCRASREPSQKGGLGACPRMSLFMRWGGFGKSRKRRAEMHWVSSSRKSTSGREIIAPSAARWRMGRRFDGRADYGRAADRRNR